MECSNERWIVLHNEILIPAFFYCTMLRVVLPFKRDSNLTPTLYQAQTPKGLQHQLHTPGLYQSYTLSRSKLTVLKHFI